MKWRKWNSIIHRDLGYFLVGLTVIYAISGLFVLKGKNGLKGRGKWFTLAGILVPLIFLLIYLY